MVEFLDPLTNKVISYHIDAKLQKIWDNLRDGKLAELNEDRVYLVDGRERTGKSTFTFEQAKYIDPTFTTERICFRPEDFLNQIKTAQKGQVVVFDEAFRGLSSKSNRSKVNKKIVEGLMEVGQRNLIIFIVLPTIFLLEIYAAVFRSEALFHVYKLKKKSGSGKRQRAFKIYNYEKKKQLYLRGKSKFFSYAKPIINKMKGKFYAKNNLPYETFDNEAYLKKKEESFASVSEKEEDEESKYVMQVDLIVYDMHINEKMSYMDIVTRLERAGIPLSRSAIQKKCEKIGKLKENA